MALKTPLIIIAGPTAVGKSELAVMLAKRIGGEIISADSMQVYRGMDIGSAKITEAEMQGIKHHLIDILDPFEEFNVALFQDLARKAVNEIIADNHIPIVCGGTGFYIQALLYGIDFDESSGEISDYRRMLLKELENSGPEALYGKLLAIDPKSAAIIHKNNTKRVIRALEFFNETGRSISDHNSEMREKESEFNAAYFVLNDERALIYQKIDMRVDKMLENGLVKEVDALKRRGLSRDNISMLGLGYKEILDYLNGIITLDEAVYLIKRDSRHFAKRQLTWYKRERDTIWLNKKDFDYDYDKILSYCVAVLKEKEIV